MSICTKADVAGTLTSDVNMPTTAPAQLFLNCTHAAGVLAAVLSSGGINVPVCVSYPILQTELDTPPMRPAALAAVLAPSSDPIAATAIAPPARMPVHATAVAASIARPGRRVGNRSMETPC